MDISLPVSEGPAAGVFSGGGSSRSVDNGKFSQTLSKEMAEQPETEPAAGQSSAAAQQTSRSQQQTTSSKSAEHADNAAQAESEARQDNAAEDTAETIHAAEPGKSLKKIAAQETSDLVPVNPGTNPQPAVSPEEQTMLNSLHMPGAKIPEVPTEPATDKTVTPAALEKTTSPAASSVLANGSTNPALLRSNAVHNEIFNSLRTQRGASGTTETGTYAESLQSGKPLQSSGKNLPVPGTSEKSDKQLSSFLPAGAQDWEYTADTLITAVSDKSAKFEALSMQFDAQSAESFSIVNAGPGKSLLAPQPGLKSELASALPVPLASEFLAGSEEWCQDFGTKIEWLNNENITKAELSLHPAELGVLDITINTEDDRISISIVTHSEKSREMLESSLPRLTELLKSQGLALENSNISHNSSPDKHNAHAQQQANPFSLSAEEQQAAELGNVQSALIRHQGQIDHYV